MNAEFNKVKKETKRNNDNNKRVGRQNYIQGASQKETRFSNC